MLLSGGAALEFDGIRCRQIFDLNYGIVDYVDWASHRANETRLPNPIMYTYLKDRGRFAEERELRISLSALGIGKFVLDDLTEIAFPQHLHLGFDFRAAFRRRNDPRAHGRPSLRPGFPARRTAPPRRRTSTARSTAMNAPIDHHFIPAFFLAQG